jgi:proline dehydrogenase
MSSVAIHPEKPNSNHSDKKGSSDAGSSLLNPRPNFEDHQAAFESKSTPQLVRAALSFGLCRVPVLARNAEPLLKASRAVLGDRVTDALLRATLFGHFCAGVDEAEIQRPIMDLQKAGIGSILDYAAEDDGTAHGGGGSGGGVGASSASVLSSPSPADAITAGKPPVGRVYDYESEVRCDLHVETFKKCIRDVATLQSDGFAAVKVTALGNPKLLERMSTAIVEARKLFQRFDLNGDG